MVFSIVKLGLDPGAAGNSGLKQIHSCTFWVSLIRYFVSLLPTEQRSQIPRQKSVYRNVLQSRDQLHVLRGKLLAYLHSDQYKGFRLYNVYRMNDSFSVFRIPSSSTLAQSIAAFAAHYKSVQVFSWSFSLISVRGCWGGGAARLAVCNQGRGATWPSCCSIRAQCATSAPW